MIEETDFKTFLYISKNEYQLFVDDKKNLKNLYKKELKIHDELDANNLNYLSKFLDDNIYQIEKLVGNFIKDIILIIENDEILSIDIGIKKKIFEKHLNQKYLENNLIKVKDLFKENFQDQIIMHMIIKDNDVNDKKNISYDLEINEDHLYLVVNFISISNSLTSVFDKLLEKHQIKISQYMSGKYIQNFFGIDASELSVMASKLKNGFNKNEVTLVSKNIENKGFFEKFFQLFS
jgi:hypothetical protein